MRETRRDKQTETETEQQDRERERDSVYVATPLRHLIQQVHRFKNRPIPLGSFTEQRVVLMHAYMSRLRYTVCAHYVCGLRGGHCL